MEIIRKISVGPDQKDAMHYIVGNGVIRNSDRIFTHSIVEIKRTGSNTFEIFIQNKNDEVYIWKSIERGPCVVEYNIEY